jgi:phage tail sheath protein FI
MPERAYPGAAIEEIPRGPRPIQAVGTTTAGFVGQTERGPSTPQLVTSFAGYRRRFGGFLGPAKQDYLPHAVSGFFRNGGRRAYVARARAAGAEPYDPAAYLGTAPDPARPETWTGLKSLEAVDEIAMLCVPDQPLVDERHGGAMTKALVAQCERLRSRICLLQSRAHEPDAKKSLRAATDSSFAAFYYPWIVASEPAGGAPTPMPATGHIAGMFARNDAAQGVWKAPAGQALGPIIGAAGLSEPVTNALQGILNPRGVNCLRRFPTPGGVVLWGARTAAAEGDYAYVNTRQLLIFIERSIDRGTQWVAFDPNEPATWVAVTRSVSEFLTALWRKGALVGRKPQDAFFVRCDRTTMTPDDIANGRLICEIGLAPVRPAEFVIIRIGQWTQEAKCR